jgi:hypothetical protein
MCSSFWDALSFISGGVHHADQHSMVHKAIQNSGRRKRGQSTAEGRQRQIVSRLNHGIRSRSPVLLPKESEAEWQQHLEGFRQSYAPVGEVEECLVHLIAYQFWRWIGRLIVYERDLTCAAMVCPKGEFRLPGDVSAEVIQEVLSKDPEELRAPLRAGFAQLSRYQALENGNATMDLAFTKPEVEELLGWFVHRIEEQLQDEEDKNADEVGSDADNVDDPDDAAFGFHVEDRLWHLDEIQRELKNLCAAAGRSWRSELSWVLYHRREELEERARALDLAKAHINNGRVLGLEELNRVLLYERQINAVLKSLIGQLERHQARRLGQPVAAPLSMDVMVSSSCDERSVQSEIP